MLIVLLVPWLLGAWLLLVCSALLWTERVRFYRRVAICAACNYDLSGLQEYAHCPECNGHQRKLQPIGRTEHGSAVILMIWLLPPLVGAMTAGMVGVLLGVVGTAASSFVGVTVLTFLLDSAFVQVMLRWLPAGAPIRLAAASVGAMVVALAVLAWIVQAENVPRDTDLLMLVPVLVWPFSGFGLLALLAFPRGIGHTRPAAG